MRARSLGVLLLLVLACQRGQRGRSSGPPLPARGSASSGATAEESEIRAALAELRREETERRAHTDFATLPPSSRSLGPNPYALASLPGTSLFVGILRGDSRVVLLDAELSALRSASTAPSPSALATAAGGHVFVAGPLAAEVERFRVVGATLEPDGEVPLPDGTVARALAADDRALVVADFVGDRLLSLPSRAALAVPADKRLPRVTSTCRGPFRLALSAHYLAVDCLFDHAVAVLERDGSGEPGREVARVVHDGPLWSIALLEHEGELWLAAGGVEDHPLDRRDRAFGYVDSFLYLYVIARDGTLARRAATNLGGFGVITPKSVQLEERDGEPVLTAFGYGSDAALELRLGHPPTTQRSVPGCSDVLVRGERRLCANPLLDAWVELPRVGAPTVHPVRLLLPRDPPTSDRLGEALFFTTLMAPDAASTGRLSRFTCETCHFEGATDGRVHHSGRHEIRVSTRPLFGLFNDAPHFSRAHDRDLTSVCHNEFAVANRGNPVDPWFSLDTARFPWLGSLGVRAARLAPRELRQALFGFLARFSDEENPLVMQRAAPRRFSSAERRGAEVFRERCAGCHAARLVADDAASLVPFERWEELIFTSSTPIVWARAEYEKSGVLPYVDPEGTRVPSLRRLYLKRPYFTNGSAHSLTEVLARARFDQHSFFHVEPEPPPSDLRELSPAERSALLDFLGLL